MPGFATRHWRKALVVPPVALGLVLVLLMAGGKAPPTRAEGGETARAARILEVPAVDLVPRATGFGQVTPEYVWQAVAQVSGRVVEVNPNLKNGAILDQGTVVARIDPTRYALTVQEREADLQELDVREQNTRASIAIEERALEVARRDLRRQRDLRGSGAASQAALDQAEKTVLSTEQSLQNLRNTLNLIPVQRALAQARLEQARLDLDYTTLTAPFDLRVSQDSITESQFATVGQVLAEGDSLAVAEVNAQFTFGEMAALIRPGTSLAVRQAAGENDVGQALGITATVRLRAGGEVEQVIEWPARLVRIADTIDPKTRTVGIIVAVEDNYARAEPGVRPPLVKNMFVEVELRGEPRPDAVVVPRLALHQGVAYLLDDRDRLIKRPVTLRSVQGDLAVVEDGIAAGDRLVISDLIPAVRGMLIDPRRDAAARARLIAAARGEAPLEAATLVPDDDAAAAQAEAEATVEAGSEAGSKARPEARSGPGLEAVR
ncbi:efflux RND transporter periplasmic adaptor subunit [Roseospira goensis]|uniref:RND family efflux transporter MFP subunit n=1 Tax=Roseospira goensis TaxID=391922 RepID=A0A7W6S2B2_9PROT|nr:HlyD family efflux transporter periplasmic adaptor subunit [Roseospira goensis]MBB4287452.1 RND family efflux transporter MFP subunit [Roseospira goensis]